jgi:hypothetical protein
MSKIAEILTDGRPVDKAALRDYLERRETVNARDFGAEPGTDRDAAPALQAAIDQARGAAVFVAPGTYRIETPLVYRAPAIVDGHIPGLKLIGAGSRVTRFDCRVPDGAAIRIDQSIGYTFSQNGLIEGIELAGVGAALPNQDGIALAGAWQYRFVDLRIRNFGRHGIFCPYRHDLGTLLTGVALARGSDRLRRDDGGFMTRLRPGDRLAGRGLAEPSTVLEVIDDRTIRASAPATESAVIDLSFGGNTDAFQTILHLDRCNIEGNGGWGIEGSGGLGLLLSWTDCAVQECRQGGVMAGGGTRLTRGIIAANGRDAGIEAAGLRLIRAPGTPQLLHVENIEFDSNHGTQVWLNYAANARFYQCRFISHVYPTAGGGSEMVPPTGIHLGGRDGGAGNARNVELEQCAWRADAQYDLAFRAIGFGTPGSYSELRVVQPLWITLVPPHHVKYAPEPHPDSAVRIEEGGSLTLAAGPMRPLLMLRKLNAQTIAPDTDSAILFDSLLQANGFVESRVPIAHAYWLELWFALAGLSAGDAVIIAFTVDDAVWREGFFRAGGLARETFQLHCVAPLSKGARVGARIRIGGAGPRTIVGGPGLAGFSLVALT